MLRYELHQIPAPDTIGNFGTPSLKIPRLSAQHRQKIPVERLFFLKPVKKKSGGIVYQPYIYSSMQAVRTRQVFKNLEVGN